ncbi:MBL fold metallo-hydrolase [Pseudohongiella spirulinae]|uniref:Beta-lactamase n=1 Tax=Pseudohongiella spirulinae TaxID=1249552 RepID=A0A0S2KER7_9GAMM|nr:MBL fold metallo-hydrolase [Pseudohongiella spirulinae]ALO46816.1 beta-lactamase [Pseudohongiella spirulinae]
MQDSRFIPGQAVALATSEVTVYRLLCPNASAMTGPGTNTYLIGSKELALVDPGPALPAHIEAITAMLAGRPLRRIFVTHTHGDHSPATAELQRLTGAEVIGLKPAAGAAYQDASFEPSRLYSDGECIDCGEYAVRLIHTPGHVSNHLCFLLEQEGMLFTGDHILQGTTPVILPPDGDMSDYLRSLEQLLGLPLRSLAPGHGDVMTEPAQMIGTLIRHRLRREQKIVSALAGFDLVTLDEFVIPVYDDVPQHLLPWAKKTLLAHLYKLESEGRVRQFAQCSAENVRWQLIDD